MKLKLGLFFTPLVLGELRDTIRPDVSTFATFSSLQVQLEGENGSYLVQNTTSDKYGAKFTLQPENTNRGIFMRICNMMSTELSKVDIKAYIYTVNPDEVDFVDVKMLFIDPSSQEEDLSDLGGNSAALNSIQSKVDETDLSCRVLGIRGVKEIKFEVLQEVDDPFTIEVTSEQWMMTSTTEWYFAMIIVLPILFAFLMCFIKGWCFCKVWMEAPLIGNCCRNRHTKLKNKLKGLDSNYDTVVKWATLILFNLDLITDFQYTVTVPFYNLWLRTVAILTLILPLIVILIPCLSMVGYGLILLLILAYNGNFGDKSKRDEIFQQYIKKYGYFAFLACFNGVQFLDKDLQKKFEGNQEFQNMRQFEMDREMDEEILKCDDQNDSKSKILQKHVIKQFKNYYTDNDLTMIKELQQDFTIFMSTWNLLSDKTKGHRIKYENVTKFFQQIGNEKFSHLAITDNEKKQKALEIRQKDGGAKTQLQSNYAFDEKINRVLGHAKMGDIYFAYLKTQKEFEVAIQVIEKKKHQKDIDSIKEAFKTMSRFDHPNIAKYWEFYEDDKNIYLVMEYVDDIGNIGQKIEEPEDDEDDEDLENDNDDEQQVNSKEQMTYKIIKQILSALSHMHSEEVLHRDIRPQNVMLDKDDNIKLVDLSLFSCRDKVSYAPEDDEFPYYSPPEEFKDKTRYEQTKASDMWAVGVLFYNLLSGKQPFQGETLEEVELNITNKVIKFNQEEFDKISGSAKFLILKLLEKDPSKRISAEDALNHPWIDTNETQTGMSREMKTLASKSLIKLYHFKSRSMLKHLALIQFVEMLKQNNMVEEYSKLEKLFVFLDQNHTMKITEQEFNNAFLKYTTLKPNSDKITDIINQVDYNLTGTVSLTEFVCATLNIEKICETEEGEAILKSVFQKFQQQNEQKNYLTKDDIIFAWNSFGDSGQDITAEDISVIFQQHDLARDNIITFEEFSIIFQSISNHDIGKVIKQEFVHRRHEEMGKSAKKNMLIKKIEAKMQFIQDDGFIYYSEFIYKIFRFKYVKLTGNIFQQKTDSLFDENDKSFDQVIADLANRHINATNQKYEQEKEELLLKKEAISDKNFNYEDEKSPDLLSPEKFASSIKKNKIHSYNENEEIAMSILGHDKKNENNKKALQKRLVLNQMYALDVEVTFAQKQDLYLYFSNLKGIKKNKPEIEDHFVDHDIRQALNIKRDIDLDSQVTLEQFTAFTTLQYQRFSRLSEFVFQYPESKIEQKYESMQVFSKILGNEFVTIGAIKEYHDEKSKPYFHDDEEYEQMLTQENENDEENQLIEALNQKSTIIDIFIVKQIFQRILDARLTNYKDAIISLKMKQQTKNKSLMALASESTTSEKAAKKAYDPVNAKFNKQLLKYDLKGSMFKQIGKINGDFTICLGDKEDLKGSRPYIDNSKINILTGKAFEDLEDPYMYVDQQMIIARMSDSRDLIILQFDRSFNKIIDGMRCRENEDVLQNIQHGDHFDKGKYIYTHSFNNWVTKKKGDTNYFRKRYSFLIKDMKTMGFILTKSAKDKDEDDRIEEDAIRQRLKAKYEDKWYNEDKDFKKQASLIKSAISFAFGILEDVPQLTLQSLNSILIGQTMSYIQLASPMASTISVFIRIYGIGSWDLFPESDTSNNYNRGKWQALCFMTCVNIFFIGFCFFPVVKICLDNYFYEEKERIEWVEENFDVVRKWEEGLY